MIKENFLKILFLIYIFLIQNVYSIENEIYKKIDLFGEVLEKINKEYVDEINQSESMDLLSMVYFIFRSILCLYVARNI